MLHTGVGPPLKYSNMKIKVVDVETQPQGEEQLATIDEAEEDYNSSKTLSSSSKEEDEPDPQAIGPPGKKKALSRSHHQQLNKEFNNYTNVKNVARC